MEDEYPSCPACGKEAEHQPYRNWGGAWGTVVHHDHACPDGLRRYALLVRGSSARTLPLRNGMHFEDLDINPAGCAA